MKTFKRALCIFLIVVMCLTSAPLSGFVGLELPEFSVSEWFASKASAASEGYYTYTITDGEATITDVNTSISGDITIPATLGGYSVTTIGERAFYDCYSLTSVTIGDSVTTIGDDAFAYCTGLTSITITDCVITIGDYAFNNCTSLTSITIPDSVTTIGDYAFHHTGYYNNASNWENNVLYMEKYLIDAKESLSGSYTIKDGTKSIACCAFSDCTGLTSITIPNSVITIDDGAFSDCTGLTSITIPNSVITIDDGAFNNCTSLTSITIPDSVTTIGDYAFHYTGYYNNASNWDNNVLYIGKHLIKAKNSLSGSYTIKDGTKSIAYYAFSDCESLMSVTIGDSVTTIGDAAFADCDSLTSITIGDSVTTIGVGAFYSCDSLTSIVVDADNPAYSSDSRGALFDKNKTILIQYPIGNTNSSYSIPDSVTTIGDWAFDSCDSLTSVTIPNSVTTIGGEAFYECTSLISITIPNSVRSIGAFAFSNCSNLKSVEFSNGVKTIRYGAFAGCNSLTSVTIPDSVITVDGAAFSNCSNLTSVVIGNNVTNIGEVAFEGCHNLVNLTWGNSVTNIGDYSFGDCRSLKSVTIPDSVESIGYGAFFSCNNLSYVTIGNRVTSIGDWAFRECTNLTSITIGDSVTTIGDSAFYSCDSLTSVTIGDSVTTIGDFAFYFCSRLTSVTIPDSVTTIGEWAFGECYNLTDVYYNGTEEQWKKINIGEYNDCLTDATIHFLGDNLKEVTTGYKREHVVDNWKALNQSYKSEYLAGFAVPMDGTNGNPDYLIPGQSENMIPQGLTYWPEKDWVLVSSYDKNEENPSAIFALDRETGAFVAQFNLKKENGKDWKPHAGGIGVSEHNLYITCDRGVAYFPLSDLDVPSGTVKDIKRADYVNFGQLGFGEIAEGICDVYTAYVNVSDGILWAGNFYSDYPGWSIAEGAGELIGLLPDSWDNPAALDYNSLVLGFKLSGKTSEDEWNNLKAICDSATYRIGIDNDLQCIQGIAFKKVEGKKYRMYLSRTTNVSFGAEITVADITLNEKNLKVSKEHCEGFKNLPGTEGIVFIGNDLHILYESGSLAYVGSLGWGTYKDLTDVIWKVNENELLGLIGVRYEGLLNHMGIKYDYDYSDSYFEDSSLNYDHDLAIASYCLAISSMVKEGTGKDGKYGTEELDAARKFFSVTEFDNCQPYGYDKKPTSDSIACVIGHKNVVLKGQEETIIAIGIRGAGYGSEWSGNFRLGNSTDHAGFAEARRLVMKYLEQYIEKFGSSFNSNLKFWVTGYSRAAATANLVAATLNNDGDLNGASFKFVNDIKDRYSIGDVYAYTFETPLNTTSKEASAAKYNNIYNFINRIDYVPKVAPSAWDYTRYGENLYMPSLETEGTRYYEYLDEMKKEYEKMTGDKYKENFDFYEVGFFMEGHDLIPDDISLTKVNGYISQSEFLDELIDIVANDIIISADNYVENYEVAARKLMPVIMDGSLDLKITWKDILDELSLLEVITGKTENMIVRVLAKKIAEAMAVSGLSYDEAYDFLGILDELVSASANNFDYVYTLIENATNIKPAHEPSVNFAWLLSIEPELEYALEDRDWYLRFVYNCPIDIALYDENGELLATIIDDKVVFSDDRYLTVYVDSDGQKCFCLPNDTEYRFEILGTDEGTMTCSVSKYDFTENKTTEILNYYDIPVEDGTELTMTVNEIIEEELTEKVEITDFEEKIVNYDDHLESEEIETFNVSVTTDTENSYVSGGGTYYKGEYAQVEAVEVGCNKFIGWYIYNTCISTELKYRLPVTESVAIEARFSEKHTMGEWYEILPAACENVGKEQRDCSECDYSETQEIPAVEHNYEAVITPATCYSNGFTTNTCTKCGNGYTSDVTAMLTHNLSDWYIVTAATCKSSGVEQRDCSECDYSETQEIAAIGHDFDGSKCKNCDYDKADDCSCNCHKGGIAGFFFKIILFFQKIFKTNQICEGCGIKHY